MMRNLFVYCLLIAALISATDLLWANDNVPSGPQKHDLLIKGATIHPVNGKPIPNGQMLVSKGKILMVVGKNVKMELAAKTQVIDLSGQHLYPGMIAANTVLGLSEISAVRATLDMAEPGKINPSARAQVSINPDSEHIPVTRANGVLASLSIPRIGSGGLIAGQSALIRHDGWTWEEMTLASPVGMHLFWPNLRTYSKWNTPADEKKIEELRKAYAKNVRALKEAFDDARAYAKAIEDSKSKGKADLRWEAMLPVLNGDLPVFIHANTLAQIQSALHFTNTEGIKHPVIVGGLDAWRLTDELKKQNASVILSQVNSLPLRRWEAYDTPYVAATKLHEAGVPFCIANIGNSFEAANERNLPYQAARAVAHGLPHDVALKAVTLFPAQILGVSDQLGSLEVGKEATFFASDGDPLEVMTQVEHAWVLGREIDLSSKHTRLNQKYQEKYRQKDAR